MSGALPSLAHYLDMVQLKLKTYSEVFFGRSADGGLTAAFPGPGETSYLSHAGVVEQLLYQRAFRVGC